MALVQVRHLTGEELDVRAAHPGPFDIDDHLPTISAGRLDLIDRTTTRAGYDERAHHRSRRRYLASPAGAMLCTTRQSPEDAPNG
jgi:hypothetical protein